MPSQIRGEHATSVGQQRCERNPVDGRTAEPVHADDNRPVTRAAEVKVVDRTVKVDPPRSIVKRHLLRARFYHALNLRSS